MTRVRALSCAVNLTLIATASRLLPIAAVIWRQLLLLRRWHPPIWWRRCHATTPCWVSPTRHAPRWRRLLVRWSRGGRVAATAVELTAPRRRWIVATTRRRRIVVAALGRWIVATTRRGRRRRCCRCVTAVRCIVEARWSSGRYRWVVLPAASLGCVASIIAFKGVVVHAHGWRWLRHRLLMVRLLLLLLLLLLLQSAAIWRGRRTELRRVAAAVLWRAVRGRGGIPAAIRLPMGPSGGRIAVRRLIVVARRRRRWLCVCRSTASGAAVPLGRWRGIPRGLCGHIWVRAHGRGWWVGWAAVSSRVGLGLATVVRCVRRWKLGWRRCPPTRRRRLILLWRAAAVVAPPTAGLWRRVTSALARRVVLGTTIGTKVGELGCDGRSAARGAARSPW